MQERKEENTNKQTKTNKQTQSCFLVCLHGLARSIVIGGCDVIIRRCEGGVPDLVLALVEQKVGSVGLKAETQAD